MSRQVELLAPAGGMDQLRAAIRYGADAVYLGLQKYGLRAYAGGFDEAALSQALALVHGAGKKLYVTLNAQLLEEELTGFVASAKVCRDLGVDAVIVSDPGAVALVREFCPQLSVHLSTQASTLNSAAAGLWHALGVSRVILGRELSLQGIQAMRAALPEALTLEAFVHGAMCVAHSGRCLVSSALTGRSANRGACAQPCRWAWRLVEQGEKAQGKALEIEEISGNTYVLSAGDLCMIQHMHLLVESGLGSLKIEGRMKSEFYVATVVGAYRRALDTCLESPQKYAADTLLQQGLLDELHKTSHRRFDTGFYFGPPQQAGGAEGFTQGAEFIAKVLKVQAGEALLSVKNRFFAGDMLECLSPGSTRSFPVRWIRDDKTGEDLQSINRPKAEVWIPVPSGIGPEDLLRGQVRNHRREGNTQKT